MTERKVKANRTNEYCKEWNDLHWIRPPDVTIVVEAIHEATDIDIENTTVVVTTIVQATGIASAAATHRCIPRRLVLVIIEVVAMMVIVTTIVQATGIASTTTHHFIPRRLMLVVVEVVDLMMMMGLLGVVVGVVVAKETEHEKKNARKNKHPTILPRFVTPMHKTPPAHLFASVLANFVAAFCYALLSAHLCLVTTVSGVLDI